jgi:hypothetical protein
MKMQYYRMDMQGERGLDELEKEVGVGGGMLLRVHVEGGKTSVYFIAEKSACAEIGRAVKAAQAPVEISADEVIKLD